MAINLRKFGRARAFYRDGSNPASSISKRGKGCWYDLRDNIGGGILGLIQHVLNCNHWHRIALAQLAGVPLQQSVHRAVESHYVTLVGLEKGMFRGPCDIRAFVAKLLHAW